MTIRSWLAAATAGRIIAVPGVLIAAPARAADAPYKVLVFATTAGVRHSSIPSGIAAVQALGAANRCTVTATEDAAVFTARLLAVFTVSSLAQFQTVGFLSTTGDALTDAQQTACEAYIRGGGGYVGVHAAAGTEYSWPCYGTLVGGWFSSHPAIRPPAVTVEDRAVPFAVSASQVVYLVCHDGSGSLIDMDEFALVG
ncbi:ThuA domain-containing protein [Dactylosporangium sp. CA-052675]|uniref:ThuA domain-containing protein n=1 Tax=Dactylosporangium sp. CA-052675 TaxID=3239927 RepID=UPI003D8AA8CB